MAKKIIRKKRQGKKIKTLFYAVGILLLVLVIYGIFSKAQFNSYYSDYYYPGLSEEEIIFPINITENGTLKYLFELKVKPNGKGDNLIIFPIVPEETKTASLLLNSIPYCDAVSYFDKNINKTVGFVAAFGGLGKDFRIIPHVVYEVNVVRDVNWTLIIRN